MMQSKTLLERLKPEIKEVVEAEKSIYPMLVEYFYKGLSETHTVSDMKYETALDVMSYHHRAFKNYPRNAWECFND